jgi:hypothetical protein
MPEGVRSAYASGICAMLDWKPDNNGRPRLLRLSPGAYSEWLSFAHTIEKQMRPGGDMEHGTDWASKAPGAAARLGGILHGIEHAQGTPWDENISVETMAAALEIVAVISRHSLAALDMMGADPTIAAARKVWEWIERQRLDSFTVRQSFNALKGTFPRVHLIHDALEALEERGYIEVQEPRINGPGRPPSPTVKVRPSIVEGWK